MTVATNAPSRPASDGFWRRTYAMLVKEFIQLRRDRVSFAMIIMIPLVQLLLFGYAINTNPRHLPTAVLLQEQSDLGRSILKALENPYVRILGHPTGRQILKRDPFSFDLEKVFAAAQRHGVILELNGNPERLDLCDRHVRLARD